MEFGTVYLLHFDRPLYEGGPSHYAGFTTDLDKRLTAHRKGRGARLTAVVSRRGIGIEVVATWTPATRADERKLKRRHQLPRLCPKCREAFALARHAEDEREARKGGRRPKRRPAVVA
jgi:predicted GIY-YIG superfamily endonuclease